MRDLLTAGTAALLLGLGAAAAQAAPANSPYAILTQEDAAPPPGQMVEGRSAFIYPDADYESPGGPGSIYGRPTSDYGPGYLYAAPVSPYRWAYSSSDFPGTEFMQGR